MTLALLSNVSVVQAVTVDFNSATSIDKNGNVVPGGDFDLYEEDGFRLFATWNGGDTQGGQIRINDYFTSTLAAHPELGFDDQDVLISTISGNRFDFLSLDIYESAGYHPVVTLLVEGIRSGTVIASQVFTTDGAAGTQQFSLTGFTNLDEVRLGGSGSSELAGVDNLAFYIIPEPATILLLGLGGLFLRKRN